MATTYGTAHLYGISGTITNATVLGFRTGERPALQDETGDESGVVIERRYDDLTTEATITLRMRAGYTVPTVGSTLTYDSVQYEVVSVDKNEQNRGYRELEISLKKSAGVSYS